MIKSRGRLAKAASQEEEARKELMPEDPPNVIRQRYSAERFTSATLTMVANNFSFERT